MRYQEDKLKDYFMDMYDRLGYIPPASVAFIDIKFPSKSTLRKFGYTYTQLLNKYFTPSELEVMRYTENRIAFTNKEMYIYGETFSLTKYHNVMFQRFNELFMTIKELYDRNHKYIFKFIMINRQLIIEFYSNEDKYWLSYLNVYERDFKKTIDYIKSYCIDNNINLLHIDNYKTRDVIETSKIISNYFGNNSSANNNT